MTEKLKEETRKTCEVLKNGGIILYPTDTTWKMANMNLAIRGIEADLDGFAADTFFDDRHKALKADFILANPPFNLKD